MNPLVVYEAYKAVYSIEPPSDCVDFHQEILLRFKIDSVSHILDQVAISLELN
jgi:hypothetical protein